MTTNQLLPFGSFYNMNAKLFDKQAQKIKHFLQ